MAENRTHSQSTLLEGDIETRFKNGFCTVLVVHGCHQVAPFKKLVEEFLFDWPESSSIFVSLIPRRESFALSSREIALQSFIAYKLTVHVLPDHGFVVHIEIMISYPLAVEDVEVKMSETRAADTEKYLQASNFIIR